MASTPQTKHAVTLEIRRVAFDPATPAPLACGRCGEALEIHQPDAETPELLLGTCRDCGAWFAIGIDGGQAAICHLLGADLMRTALAAPGPATPGESAGHPA